MFVDEALRKVRTSLGVVEANKQFSVPKILCEIAIDSRFRSQK
jgi:hypothetical protein